MEQTAPGAPVCPSTQHNKMIIIGEQEAILLCSVAALWSTVTTKLMKLNAKASVKVRCGHGRSVWSLKLRQARRRKRLSLHQGPLKWTFCSTGWGLSRSICFRHTHHTKAAQIVLSVGENTRHQSAPAFKTFSSSREVTIVPQWLLHVFYRLEHCLALEGDATITGIIKTQLCWMSWNW